ncbi:MAG: hypothetical protein ACTS44_01700 [Candidatus Hodgkinia cicadicola]
MLLNISLANQLCHLLQLHFIEFNTSVWTIDLSLIVIFPSVDVISFDGVNLSLIYTFVELT